MNPKLVTNMGQAAVLGFLAALLVYFGIGSILAAIATYSLAGSAAFILFALLSGDISEEEV